PQPVSLVLSVSLSLILSSFFFFNHHATTHIYPLSLHDALPIFAADHDRQRPRLHLGDAPGYRRVEHRHSPVARPPRQLPADARADRKSTRLNSSHGSISYAVFCLKKKKK